MKRRRIESAAESKVSTSAAGGYIFHLDLTDCPSHLTLHIRNLKEALQKGPSDFPYTTDFISTFT